MKTKLLNKEAIDMLTAGKKIAHHNITGYLGMEDGNIYRCIDDKQTILDKDLSHIEGWEEALFFSVKVGDMAKFSNGEEREITTTHKSEVFEVYPPVATDVKGHNLCSFDKINGKYNCRHCDCSKVTDIHVVYTYTTCKRVK